MYFEGGYDFQVFRKMKGMFWRPEAPLESQEGLGRMECNSPISCSVEPTTCLDHILGKIDRLHASVHKIFIKMFSYHRLK